MRRWAIILLLSWALVGCSRVTPTPVPSTTPLASLPSYPGPSALADAGPPTPTNPSPSHPSPIGATRPPAPLFTLRPTPLSTPTPYRTIRPIPTLVPTVDPALLPGLLQNAFKIEPVAGIEGHPLSRVTGWEYGVFDYWWLDDEHLLLFPLVGEEEPQDGPTQWTMPVVLDLLSGNTWQPQQEASLGIDQIAWSAALQSLVVIQGNDVLVMNTRGETIQRFLGNGYDSSPSLYLSPSGRRLVMGDTWYDLEAGQQVEFEAMRNRPWRPAWSSDESRLFFDDSTFVDTRSGQSYNFQIENLMPVGRGGGGLSGQWVLSDTMVMIRWEFHTVNGDERILDPLIDPIAQNYTTMAALTGRTADVPCREVVPVDAGQRLLQQCQSTLYVLEVASQMTYTLPAEYNLTAASPDGRFAVLGKSQLGRGYYGILALNDGRFQSLPDDLAFPANWDWQQPGQHLENHFVLFFSQDLHTLYQVDVSEGQIVSLVLPISSAFAGAYGHPQENSLAIQGHDGSIWWVRDVQQAVVERLSPPMSPTGTSWWNIRWSPSGKYLALGDGRYIYVLTVESDGAAGNLLPADTLAPTLSADWLDRIRGCE